MNRRGFLSSCLALAAAPAIVRADSLMRIIPRNAEVLLLDEYVVTAVSGNHFVSITEITAAALKLMHESQVLFGRCGTSYLDGFKVGDRFTIAREKVGSKIRVRLPERQ